MPTYQSQFKTLVQNEMTRLKALQIEQIPVKRQAYTESFQNATLILRQLKNQHSFSRMLRFLSLF